MGDQNYTIRTASPEEMSLLTDWAAEEGWNPGLYDADSFYAADPEGFLIGYLNDEPIASISAVKYGEHFGFIGFYIVKPEYRGKGYGLQIWKAAMEQLEGRCIGLDGVVDQQHNYRKSGFTLAHRNGRYEGEAAHGPSVDRADISSLDEQSLQYIAAYDQAFFPEKRDAFLRKWIAQKEGKSLGIWRNNELNGYGVRRKCRTGYKIGPLFADDSENASILLHALISDLKEGTPFFLDIPAINPSAVELVENNDMEMVFETARMYRGEAPQLPLEKIYGVTTFELG